MCFCINFLILKTHFGRENLLEDKNSLQTIKFEKLLLAGGWAHWSLLADEQVQSRPTIAEKFVCNVNKIHENLSSILSSEGTARKLLPRQMRSRISKMAFYRFDGVITGRVDASRRQVCRVRHAFNNKSITIATISLFVSFYSIKQINFLLESSPSHADLNLRDELAAALNDIIK